MNNITANAGAWPEADSEMRRPGALAGIRIVDLCVAGPGPFGTLVLASYGADVIHLSRTGPIDSTLDASHHNCGKRSIRVDLKVDDGKDILRRLVADADVLVEGFRPGVMERLGLGPEALLAINPRLLYVRMTGWGQAGPYANMPGHDINYLAISGALSVIGRDQPQPPLALLGDFSGGALMAVISILAAIRERDDTGIGRVIDTNIADGVAMLMHSTLSAAPRSKGLSVVKLLNGTAPFYRTYRCADGQWFSVGAIEPKFYANLLTKLGLSEDPVVNRQYDVDAWPAISNKMAERFAQKSRDEWTALLVVADACAFPVLEPHEIADDPHLAARKTAIHSSTGVRIARAGRYADEPATPLDEACEMGASTAEVLRGLGYEKAAIETLFDNGVVEGPVSHPAQ